MSLDRRQLIATAGAAALAPAAASAAEADHLKQVFDQIYDDAIKASPERLTSLGFDRQPQYAWAKSKLSDRSAAGADAARARLAREVAALKKVDRAKLTGMARINYDTVLFDRETSLEGARRFKYGDVGEPNPYVISLNAGAYRSVPQFLANQHVVETREDAEAYIERLRAYARVLDQETERFRQDSGRGVVPPDFLFDKAIDGLGLLAIEPADKSPLVTSFARKAQDKSLAGAWTIMAEGLVNAEVRPALARQLTALRAARVKAGHAAGMSRFPDGRAYYDWTILANTTTRISADEVHKMGLIQVQEATARADALLRAQGLTQGTVGARIGALNADPRFLYPETEEGRAKLTARVKALIAAMTAQMPRMFTRFPKREVEVRPSPPAQEANSPGAYYSAGSADGRRPGIYYINMRLVGASPDWQLPTITFHEAIPGHHHQISIAREAAGEAHPIMRGMDFTAYGEGWGLYSEQLGDELGLYADDPFGKIGYYRSMLFRAARLVVDTGIHAKGWSREEAIAYLVGNVGMSERGMISETERYCGAPGQACAYKLGHARWNAVRDMARKELGARFDIKAFHDDALVAGAMPLAVLETFVADWVAGKKA